MAVFNPQVPDTQDPSYLHLSKPITQPEFKSGSAIAIESAGRAISGAITGADDIVKAFAKNVVEEKVYPEREEYIQALNAGDAVTRLQAAGVTQPEIIPDKPEQEVPQGVKTAIRSAEVIQGARANGHISETDYYGRLMAIAKDVRSKFPVGYRDYIDHQISRITGVDPANAYIRSIIADINSFAGKANEDNKHVQHELDKLNADGVKGADVAAILHSQGKWNNDQGRAFIGQAMAKKGAVVATENDLKLLANNRAIASEPYTQFFRQKAEDHIMTDMKMLDEAYKAHGVERDEFDNLHMNPAQAQDYAAWIDTKEQVFRKKALEMAMSRKASDGSDLPFSLYSLKGAETKTEIDNMAAYYTWAKSRIVADKTGDITRAANLAQRWNEQTKLEGLQGKLGDNLKTIYRTMDQYKGFPDWLQSALGAKILGDLAVTDKQKNDIAIDTIDRLGNYNPLQPKTLNQSIEEKQKQGFAVPSDFEGFLRQHIGISLDPNAPESARLGYMAGIANPKNRGLIDKFQRDDHDPVTGRPIPGQVSVFRRLTSDSMQQAFTDMGRKYPWLVENYMNWQKYEANGLIRREVGDLGSLQNQPNLAIAYDSDKHGFHLIIKDGKKIINSTGEDSDQVYYGARNRNTGVPAMPLIEPIVIEQSRRAVNKVNDVMKSLSKAAELNGGDVDHWILQTLVSSFGMTIDPTKVEGLPVKFINALNAGRKQQEEAEKKTEPK